VACNSYLREKMLEVIPAAIFVPPVLCTDNAAMIGALALQMAQKGLYTKPSQLVADSSLEII
jgi:tRNA A37 threonylcarbamoyltransferase TsaD